MSILTRCDENQWTFIAKGRLQLVFRKYSHHESSSEEDNLYSGKVLKLSTQLPSHYYQIHDQYVKWVLYPWFRDISIMKDLSVCQIDATLVKELLELSGSIQSFQVENNDQVFLYGLLERDYNYVYHTMREKKHLSVEIKVKCGLSSCSPFVRRCNTIKYSIGRFKLMQIYKQNTHSLYNPNDICSLNRIMVSRAWNHLIGHDRRYVKVSLNGERIYGWKGVSNTGFFVNKLQEFTGLTNSYDALTELIVATLIHTTTMRDLEVVQGLDFIDVEGVNLIYHKLLSFHDNDAMIVDNLILNYLSTSVEPVVSQLRNLSSVLNKYRVSNEPEAYTSDDLYCEDALEMIQSPDLSFLTDLVPCLIDIARKKNPSSEVIRASRQWLRNLTETQCLRMIQLWMTALTAKDCSLFVTFQLDDVLDSDIDTSTLDPSTISVHVNESNKTIRLYANDIDTWKCLQLSYNIGMTDLGPKDIQKIYKKDLEEDMVCAATKDYLERNEIHGP